VLQVGELGLARDGQSRKRVERRDGVGIDVGEALRECGRIRLGVRELAAQRCELLLAP
jgi:hypothetical protein